jgi:hypothetical protein
VRDPKPVPRVLATASEWDLLVAELPLACQICGSTGYDSDLQWIGLSVHHVVSKAQRGDDVKGNLAVLCGHGTAGCHGDVEHRRSGARERLREHLTTEQLRYVVKKKGSGWLDTHYPRRSEVEL